MKTSNTRFKRLLRLRDFELFKVVINNNYDVDQTPYFLIHDERFPQDSDRGNHVAIYLVSQYHLSDSLLQDILNFNHDLFDMKHNCSYFMEEKLVDEDFDSDFPNDTLAIHKYAQEILSLFKIDVVLPEVEEFDFIYLSQEK